MIGDLLAHAAAHSDIRTRDWDDMTTAGTGSSGGAAGSGSAAAAGAGAGAGAGGGRCFVEDVIKGVSTMHRVLYQLLPPAQVQDVFSRIFDLLAHRLAELYLGDDSPTVSSQLQQQPQTTAGHQRRMDEVTHLVTSLGLLRGVDAGALARLEARVREQQLAFQQKDGGAASPSVQAPSS